ncbi:NFATC2-interacting protein [Nymphon striatum]|nr:NFATC2-interacting protein [Nymphon striatum]
MNSLSDSDESSEDDCKSLTRVRAVRRGGKLAKLVESSDDESLETSSRSKCRATRGSVIKVVLNHEDLPTTCIYTNKVNKYVELRDKIDDISYVQNVIGPNNDKSEEDSMEKITDRSDELEDISVLNQKAVMESPPPPPPPPCNLNNINIPKRRPRLKRGMKKVMDNLENAAVNYKKLKPENYNLDDDDVMIYDVMSPKITSELKIRVNSEIIRLPYSKNQKFFDIINLLSKQHEVHFEDVLLTFNDRKITADSTPLSMNLSVIDIIECYITKKKKHDSNEDIDIDENSLHLKLQSKLSKKKEICVCKKYHPIQEVLKKYAEKLQVDVKKLSIQFDGEDVDCTATPFELEFEDGDCLDVISS